MPHDHAEHRLHEQEDKKKMTKRVLQHSSQPGQAMAGYMLL